MLRDHRLLLARRRPAVGLPAGRRHAIAEGADHHEDEIDHAHHHEGLPDADIGRGLEVVHQDVGERRADHGAAAEAHDGHAGRHAAAVGKPFDQRRHRRDVAEAETDAADHAGAEPHQPELVDVNPEGAEQQAAAPAERRDEAGLARADALEPAAPDRGRDAEQHEEQREHPAHAGDAPVAGRGEQLLHQRHVGTGLGCRQPDGPRQRQPEHGKAVGHADAQMNAKRRRRHQPAIEAGLCNCMLAIENPLTAARHRACAIKCSHSTLPYSRPCRACLRVHDPVIISSCAPRKRLPCCFAPFRMRRNRGAHPKQNTPNSNTTRDRICRAPTPDSTSTQDCVSYYWHESALRPTERRDWGRSCGRCR